MPTFIVRVGVRGRGRGEGKVKVNGCTDRSTGVTVSDAGMHTGNMSAVPASGFGGNGSVDFDFGLEIFAGAGVVAPLTVPRRSASMRLESTSFSSSVLSLSDEVRVVLLWKRIAESCFCCCEGLAVAAK